PAGVSDAIEYLKTTQRADGAWSHADAANGDHWFTAEVVLALVDRQTHAGVDTALGQARAFLEGTNPTATTSATLARVALALFKLNGLDSIVDSQMSALINQQVAPGDWGNVLASANAVTALAHAMGMNPQESEQRVVFADEQLRYAVNQALGRDAYSHITRADLLTLTSLDLRATSVHALDGLQGATNLVDLRVNHLTDLTAMAGMEAVAILIDTDLDEIADSMDNCWERSNSNQADLDG